MHWIGSTGNKMTLTIQELEQLFQLMTTYKVTHLVHNETIITLPLAKPTELAATTTEEHPTFKEPQSDLDRLMAGMKNGQF